MTGHSTKNDVRQGHAEKSCQAPNLTGGVLEHVGKDAVEETDHGPQNKTPPLARTSQRRSDDQAHKLDGLEEDQPIERGHDLILQRFSESQQSGQTEFAQAEIKA